MRFIGSIANRIWEPKLRPYPPETPADWEKRLRMLRIVTGAALLAVLSWQAWRIPAQAGTAAASRIDPVLKNLNGTLANINAATLAGKNLVEQAGKDYYDPKDPEAGFYWDIQQMIYNSTASSRQTEEFIEDLRANILGGRDTRGVEHEGVIPAATGLLSSLKDTSNHFRTDLDKLSDSADGALKPLKSALENVAGLSADLEKQMAAGGDVAGTFHQLDLAVGNVNTLIEDPNIQKILANSADTSQHLAESAKSVDLAMRPWRERAHFLKTILLKAIGMVKFVYQI